MRVQKLSILLLKSYIGPFIITFLVAMFIFEMQFIWVYLDDHQKNWLVPHVPGLLTLEGQFTFKRIEASDGSVAWFHLNLAPDAVSAVSTDARLSQGSGPLQHSHSH